MLLIISYYFSPISYSEQESRSPARHKPRLKTKMLQQFVEQPVKLVTKTATTARIDLLVESLRIQDDRDMRLFFHDLPFYTFYACTGRSAVTAYAFELGLKEHAFF